MTIDNPDEKRMIKMRIKRATDNKSQCSVARGRKEVTNGQLTSLGIRMWWQSLMVAGGDDDVDSSHGDGGGEDQQMRMWWWCWPWLGCGIRRWRQSFLMLLVYCKSATSEGYDAYFANWSCWLSLSLQSSVVNMFQASIEGSLECKALLTYLPKNLNTKWKGHKRVQYKHTTKSD